MSFGCKYSKWYKSQTGEFAPILWLAVFPFALASVVVAGKFLESKRQKRMIASPNSRSKALNRGSR